MKRTLAAMLAAVLALTLLLAACGREAAATQPDDPESVQSELHPAEGGADSQPRRPSRDGGGFLCPRAEIFVAIRREKC